jgi:hypothetical protein
MIITSLISSKLLTLYPIKMKYKKLVLVSLMLTIFIISTQGQYTLYVPSGTSGIGPTVSGNYNVGIGTGNAPSQKLHVNGNVLITGYIKGNEYGGGVKFEGDGGKWMKMFPGTLGVTFLTNQNGYYIDKQLILNNGTINTYGADLILQTDNTTRLTYNNRNNYFYFSNPAFFDWFQMFGFADLTNGYPSWDLPRLVFSHNHVHGWISYQDNLQFSSHNNGVCTLTLYGNETVGIGFTATTQKGQYQVPDGYKLGVNGKIICEEVKVIGNVEGNPPDYVFDAEYNLMSLSELGKYIAVNKHLPDIPSAEQFKEDGYKVGEMNELLLRKIEELTLYVISLKKENEDLRQMITSQEE